LIIRQSKKPSGSYIDEAWKTIMESCFEDFMALCWPEAYRLIDWDKGYEFLEQEFYAIHTESAIGRRVSDKLIKAYLKDGLEQWFFIH
jgi:hypothetical protein